MSAEPTVSPLTEGAGFSIDISSDRRADIEAKQFRVATLLREHECDGMLLIEQENVAWLTSGATPRGHLDAESLPALFCTPESRWLICSNVDSQRLFDEELDGLGFQLKEWPWHWGREQFFADLCPGRKVACDAIPSGEVEGDFHVIAGLMGKARRVLTPYEQACLFTLGQVVSHAVEAACRTLQKGDTEREVAGQLAHRMMHRGVQPVELGIAADGRSRVYRRVGFTGTPIERYAVVTATGRKYGLHVTTSRTMCFGDVPEDLKKEHSTVVRVTSGYLAATWPDAVPREILLAGRRIYLLCGHEHEWHLAPQGHVTGRNAVEMMIRPTTQTLLEPGWPVVWTATAGAAVSCDTYLVSERGPRAVTPPEVWPLKRVRIQGAECTRPDILVR